MIDKTDPLKAGRRLAAEGVWLAERVLTVRFIRFGLVAGTSGAVYFLAALLLSGAIGLASAPASALAYLAAIPVNFAGQKVFTFRSKKKVVTEFGPYLLLQSTNIVVSGAIMSAAVNLFRAPIYIGGACVIIAVSLVSYLAMTLIFVDKTANQN